MLRKNRLITIVLAALFMLFSISGVVLAQTSARDKAEPKTWGFDQNREHRYIWYGEYSFYNKSFSDEVFMYGDIIGENIKLGRSVLDSLGRTLIYVQNKNGGSLVSGDALVWDNTAIEVVASAACAVSHTIANNLTGESGFLSVTIVWTGTPDAGDSVYVYGTTYENGVGDTACVLIDTTSGGTVMAKKKTGQTILHFSDIDSVECNADAVANGASAIVVNAYAVTGVIACDGANTDIAGVAIVTIADNAYGYICTHGICKCTVDAATLAATPGVLLEGAADGDLVTDATATTGKNIGRALEYSNLDNTQILIFVDTF